MNRSHHVSATSEDDMPFRPRLRRGRHNEAFDPVAVAGRMADTSYDSYRWFTSGRFLVVPRGCASLWFLIVAVPIGLWLVGRLVTVPYAEWVILVSAVLGHALLARWIVREALR